jgi:hypothetical protein
VGIRRLALLASLGAAGCVSIETAPEPPASVPPAKLHVHLEFEGDRSYLPRLFDEAAEGDPTAPTVHYEYQASYEDGSRVSFWDNRHWREVTAQGVLQLEIPGKDPKTMIEQCVVTVKYPLIVFNPPTDSELRRRALVCVRDWFDARLTHASAKASGAD